MTTPLEPPRKAPAGFRWEAVEQDAEWRVVRRRSTQRHPLCRMRSRNQACGTSAVVELNRGRWSQQGQGRVDAWWAYCADHSYGRWVEDGRVMGWRLVEIEEQPDAD